MGYIFRGFISSPVPRLLILFGILDTPGFASANLFFAVLFILCAYNFFRAITLDAGVCPVPIGEEEKKLVSSDSSGYFLLLISSQIIENLTSEGRLNGQTFCVSCMAQKPLRSKHCRHCDRCVARHDQYVLHLQPMAADANISYFHSHCPWVWNCVGVNNHRQFIVFVSTLVFGIIVFDYLAWQCQCYFISHFADALMTDYPII